MEERLAQPAAVIAAHLREWGAAPAHVELAVFGSDEPAAIATHLDDFCRRQLSAGVARALFYQSSIGSVSGVELDDGRRVVVKAHQPDQSLDKLREVVRVQQHLAAHGLYATRVEAGPAPLGRGYAIVERFVDGGTMEDAHRPEIRRALAVALHDIVAACRPLVASSTLPPDPLSDLPPLQLWPTPHSKLFDFTATVAGAEWIDAVASAARRRLAPAGDLVIGHADWRVEHVRFGDGRPLAAFDWDSLSRLREPALVGITAHAFCADWTRHRATAPAPTLDEARAFVADYEAARGVAFGADERRLAGATFAYACSYTARCGHATGADERAQAGTFMHLVAGEGLRLLEL